MAKQVSQSNPFTAAAGGGGQGDVHAFLQMPQAVPVYKQHQLEKQKMRVRAFQALDCDVELTGLPDFKRRRLAKDTVAVPATAGRDTAAGEAPARPNATVLAQAGPNPGTSAGRAAGAAARGGAARGGAARGGAAAAAAKEGAAGEEAARAGAAGEEAARAGGGGAAAGAGRAAAAAAAAGDTAETAGGDGMRALTARRLAGPRASQCTEPLGGKPRWSLLCVQDALVYKGFRRFGDLILVDRINVPGRVAWECFRPALKPGSRELTVQIRVPARDLARLPAESAAVTSWAAAKGAGGGAVAAVAPGGGVTKGAPVGESVEGVAPRGLLNKGTGGGAVAGTASAGGLGKEAPAGGLRRAPYWCYLSPQAEVLPDQRRAEPAKGSAAAGGARARVGATAATGAVAAGTEGEAGAAVRLEGLGRRAAAAEEKAETGLEAARRGVALGKEIAAAAEGEDASPGVASELQDSEKKRQPAADNGEGAVVLAEIMGRLTYGNWTGQRRSVKNLRLSGVAKELCGFEDWQLQCIDVVRTDKCSRITGKGGAHHVC